MKRSLVFLLGLILILFLAGCTISVKISTLPVNIDIANPVVAGSPHFATAIIKDDYDNYTYKWSAADGYIDPDTDTNWKTIWEAPNSSGRYKINLVVKKDGKEIPVSKEITVVESDTNINILGHSTSISGKHRISISVTNNSHNEIDTFSYKIALWDKNNKLIPYQGEEAFTDSSTKNLLPGESTTISCEFYVSSSVSYHTVYIYEIDYADGSYWEAN